MFQEFGVTLQSWGDCFAEFEEPDGPVEECFQLLAVYEGRQLGIVCRSQDKHVAELTSKESQWATTWNQDVGLTREQCRRC